MGGRERAGRMIDVCGRGGTKVGRDLVLREGRNEGV